MTYPMGKAGTLGLTDESMRESSRKAKVMGEESRPCPMVMYMRESFMMTNGMGKAGTLGLMDESMRESSRKTKFMGEEKNSRQMAPWNMMDCGKMIKGKFKSLHLTCVHIYGYIWNFKTC
jgi:hypothetical protein